MLKVFFTTCIFCVLMASTVFALSIEDSLYEDSLYEDSLREQFSVGAFFELEEVHEIELFQITNRSLSDAESTFSDILAISGQAPRNTTITISVYIQDEYDAELLILKDFFELLIGSSGIFSHMINLSMGENYILIYAHNNDGVTFIRTIVNRKDDEIKQELSRGLAFPGRSILNRRVMEVN